MKSINPEYYTNYTNYQNSHEPNILSNLFLKIGLLCWQSELVYRKYIHASSELEGSCDLYLLT